MTDFKGPLLAAMEAYFGADARRVNHARRVLGHAEDLLGAEKGDRDIVLAAAVLHDIGIHEAERKYGSTSGRYQEIEGPPIAQGILASLGLGVAQIEEVCEIIANHHSPGRVNTQNFRILYDADWLVNLGDEYDIHDRKKLESIIATVFLTVTGKTLARKLYLGEDRALKSPVK